MVKIEFNIHEKKSFYSQVYTGRWDFLNPSDGTEYRKVPLKAFQTKRLLR